MADGIADRFDRYTSGPNVGTPTYTAEHERWLGAVLVHPASALLARPGVRPGPGGAISFGGSPEAVTIQPCSGIITDTGAGGSFKWVIPQAVTIPLPTRPATGQTRISDLVGVILNDEVRGADGTREMDVKLINGAAGSSPAAPTLDPPGALRLRRLTIAPTGTPALSMAPQRIAALGGTIPVASQAERDAIEVMYPGLTAYREDAESLDLRIGAGWKALRQVIDTGWTTLASNLTTGGIAWRRVDDEIWVQVDGNFASTSGTEHPLTTTAIPSANRPAPPFGPGYRSGALFSGYAGALTVKADGHVYAQQTTGGARSTVGGLIKYPIG